MAKDNPVFGYDYDLERWSAGARDENGHLIWHERLPENHEWQDIRQVTLNFGSIDEPIYRNYDIDPDRPLDVYGTDLDSPDHYDLDDLALQAFLHYGWEF